MEKISFLLIISIMTMLKISLCEWQRLREGIASFRSNIYSLNFKPNDTFSGSLNLSILDIDNKSIESVSIALEFLVLNSSNNYNYVFRN